MNGAPDIAVVNARIHTMDRVHPLAEAVAMRGDRIVFVGSDAEVRGRSGSSTEVIDAQGGLVLPGFVDSHNHVRLGTPDAVDLSSARTLEEIHTILSAHIRANPGIEWIEAGRFNYSAIPGGRMPRAEDLPDTVTGGRPAFITSYDAHTVWMNRPALERFGIRRGVERVAFGEVATDPGGEPTGFVTGFAVMGLSREGLAALEAVLPGLSRDRQYARLVGALAMAVGYGITTVVEPQNSPADVPLFVRARREGALLPRVIAAMFHPVGTTTDDVDAFDEAKRLHDDDRFRVGPIKLYIDDVIEPHTAAMLEDYANLPGVRGQTFWDPTEFAELMAGLERRGFQTFTHATGDRGIRTVLDAVEHARRTNGPHDARHQIVHVECLTRQDIPRLRELGVVACMQPRHCAPDIVGGDWQDNVGPGRWRYAWAFRSLRDAGAPLAFSSDWDVAEMDPLVGIYTALTRADKEGNGAWVPEETIDLDTAIRAYTIGGAYANFAEDDRGSITAGKYADLIVLSDDLFALEDPRAILDARVELTMVGGEIVHRVD